MPTNQALQVFYGTLPLILIILGVWFREQMLLKDVLAHLGRVKATLQDVLMRLTRLEAPHVR